MSGVAVGVLLAGLGVLPEPGFAPQQDSPVQLADVVVTARRGSTDIAPEREVGPAEIDALGLWSAGELISRLGSIYGESQPPVIIVNGRRVANPRLYYDLPPDAVSRVEILPQGSAAAFGGPPTSRTINLVLERRFTSRDGDARIRAPTAGGFTGLDFTGRASRLVDLDITGGTLAGARTTALWADERADLRLPSSEGSATLRPATRRISGQVSVGRTIGDWSASLQASAYSNESLSVSRERYEPSASRSAETAVGVLIGLSGQWSDWNVLGNVRGHVSDVRREGRINLESLVQTVGVDGSATRRFSGWTVEPATLSFDSGFVESRTDTRGLTAQRETAQTGFWTAQMLAPLVRREAHATAMDLALSVGRQIGDSGGGSTMQVGLVGGFGPKVRANAAWRHTTAAPAELDRLAPVGDGIPIVVYDFRTGHTVRVETIEGGNPNLRPTTEEAIDLGLALGPFGPLGVQTVLSFSTRHGTDGVVRDLAVTAANENRYPGRFERDIDGRLTRIDRRPINLAGFSSTEIALTLTASLPPNTWVPVPVRLQARYGRRLEDEMTLDPASGTLDRLAGDNGGRAPENVLVEMSAAQGRWSLNLSARWEAGYRARQTAGHDQAEDLVLASSSSVDVKLGWTLPLPSSAISADARRPAGGTRLELAIENLADSRRQARAADGTPAWRGHEIDPVGRVVRLRLSQRF